MLQRQYHTKKGSYITFRTLCLQRIRNSFTRNLMVVVTFQIKPLILKKLLNYGAILGRYLEILTKMLNGSPMSHCAKTIFPRSWNIIGSSKRACKYHLSINFLAEKKTAFPITEKFKTRTFQ